MNLPYLDIPLGWIDVALLAVFAVSALVGLWRGFVFEIVSLLGWVVAFILANALGPLAAKFMPFGGAQDAQLRLWVAVVVVFVLVLITCTLLARLLRVLISATPLSFVDHLLGGMFGMVRGAVILVAVGLLVMLSPYADSTAWKNSHGSAWVGLALEGLKPILPQSLSVHINT